MGEERLRSKKAFGFADLMRLVASLWQKCGHGCGFVRLGNMEDWASFPVVTYHVVSRRVAEGFRERRPRYRDVIHGPDGSEVGLLAQTFEWIVQFTVWARSNDEADAWQDVLEDFLLTYTPVLLKHGAARFWFEEQLEDRVGQSGDAPLYVRALRYRLVMERVTPVPSQVLRQVMVEYDIKRPPEGA